MSRANIRFTPLFHDFVVRSRWLHWMLLLVMLGSISGQTGIITNATTLGAPGVTRPASAFFAFDGVID